jgi:hypothetical protein
MKIIKTLSVLAGVGAPLILAGGAEAGFRGIKAVAKPSIQGRFICNIYAEFDRPGEDHLNIVGGTPDNPLQIDVISGKFFNPTFASGDLAPSPDEIAMNANAAEDTFVTVGVKVFNDSGPGQGGQPTNNTGFAPGWTTFGTTSLSNTGFGWFVTPFDPQGDPFNPDYVAGNGQILIAQLTIQDSDGDGFVAVSGQMILWMISNGTMLEVPATFFHIPGPGGLAALGLAGLLGRRRRRT